MEIEWKLNGIEWDLRGIEDFMRVNGLYIDSMEFNGI